MAGTADIVRIQAHDWPQLLELWKRIALGNVPEWADGKAMEHLVLRAFELDGADVVWPYSVRLQGKEVEQIDGVVHCKGLSCLVESKDTTDKVNVTPITKLRYQLLRRPSGALGLVFSRSGFTEPALILAQFMSPLNILLYEGEEVEYLLKRQSMVNPLLEKYRRCIEQALPNYDTRAGAIT